MTVSVERFFSQADHAAIEAAVRDVEAQSDGEIVPYAVERSDPYLLALWTAATLSRGADGRPGGRAHPALG